MNFIIQLGCWHCGQTGFVAEDGYCVKCGRSSNKVYELKIMDFICTHESEFRNWHDYGSADRAQRKYMGKKKKEARRIAELIFMESIKP
jgi:ribosomal protein L37E